MKLVRDMIDEAFWLLREWRAGRGREAVAVAMDPAAPPSWQIFKYLLIGGLSVFVFYGAYGLFRVAVEKALGFPFEDHRFAWNTAAIVVAFIPTNWFTYTTNRRWVFRSGKHAPAKEFFLFTLAAALSFLVGEIGAWWVIHHDLANDFVVTLSFIALSTIANFAFRKAIVFHG